MVNDPEEEDEMSVIRIIVDFFKARHERADIETALEIERVMSEAQLKVSEAVRIDAFMRKARQIEREFNKSRLSQQIH